MSASSVGEATSMLAQVQCTFAVDSRGVMLQSAQMLVLLAAEVMRCTVTDNANGYQLFAMSCVMQCMIPRAYESLSLLVMACCLLVLSWKMLP